ncbi:DUF5804 family protein [Natronorubrum halophilum]|uniref:DUF5804 family protein n=1 Tax=Natronorubrum halophilum TaxID=1702106 RepID=UPI000EF6CE3F|nr:DUF5804 family protein [Natronorubrum halophilum]
MTRVCLIGKPDCNLQYELLSRETSREALATYDLERPFENSLSLHTVSVGAAVSLLNDLNWYLTRFVDEALVQEPSVSEDEWLSRSLARALRNGSVEPDETAEFCKIYGLERVGADSADSEQSNTNTNENANGPGNEGRVNEPGSATPPSRPDGSGRVTDSSGADGSDDGTESGRNAETTVRLVEPLYVRRTDGDLPGYDLRDVEETLVVRLTEAEHSP